MIVRTVKRIRTSLKTRYEIGSRRRTQARLRRLHKKDLPQLNDFDQRIVDALERDGAVVTSLTELAADGLSSEFDLQAASDVLANPQLIIDYPKDYMQQASLEQLASVPQIIRWGLEERFLAIAQNYIGLPAAYRGLVLRRDLADGKDQETRIWHRDVEDVRIMKIIVYIRDVDENGGGFRFIPRSHSPTKGIEYVNGRVPADIMAGLVSDDKYVTCIGSAGTVLFADPTSIWHHGCVPESAHRLTAFFAYNSQRPLRPHYCQPLFPAHYLGDVTLSNAQTAAIDYDYPVIPPAAGAKAA